jgi:hypothetical protein
MATRKTRRARIKKTKPPQNTEGWLFLWAVWLRSQQLGLQQHPIQSEATETC